MLSIQTISATMTASTDICDHVLIALRRIIRAIDLHSRRLVQDYGLTGPQLVVLKELSRLEQISLGDLAKAVSLSDATVTGILSRLKSRGLVQTRRGDSDRRRLLITATPAAADLLRAAPPLLQERFVAQFQKLRDWEKTLVLASLQRIVAMMEADRLEALPFLASGPLATPTQQAAEPPSAPPSYLHAHSQSTAHSPDSSD